MSQTTTTSPTVASSPVSVAGGKVTRRIAAMRMALRALYAVIKACTRVDTGKVVFLGRRMNRMPLDFQLIIDELRRRDPDVRVETLTMLVKGERGEARRFAPLLLRSLFHLATAKVCVLDSYWPAVSLLEHRDELVVYQLWHSLGKIKQSGKQALGRGQGRSAQLAQAMRMHDGYDYVVAGAKVWNPQYRAAFGVSDDQLLNIGLPRADYLIQHRDDIAVRIFAAYPELRSKPVVLYAPTFRRGHRATGALELAEQIDTERFHLVIKAHESDTLAMPTGRYFTCPEFSGSDLLTIADHLITDYSSIALEAALIDTRTYYYLYDDAHYLATNGVNIDLDREMPGCVFRDAAALASALDGDYPDDVLRAYKQKFLFPDPGHSTTDLVDHFVTKGGLCIR